MRVISKMRKGQTTLEYAILIIIIIGALLTIQNYVKRGIQGRQKSATDDIGDQYDPGNTNVQKWTNSYSKTRDTFFNGQSQKTLTDAESTNTDLQQNIFNKDSAYWGEVN